MKHKLNFLFDYVFPTFILPNATNFELGIVNYLVTRHNSNFKYNSLFQFTPESGDLFSKLFGNSMAYGSSPSQMGFFYESTVYNDIIEYDHNSVWLHTSKNNGKFIYPIKASADLQQLSGGDTLGISPKAKGEYFWKNISKYVLDMVDEGRAKILIDYSMEPFITKETHQNFNRAIRAAGFRRNAVVICVNSFNARELYESWFPIEEQMYQVRNIPFCIDYSAHLYKFSPEWFPNQKMVMDVDYFLSTKNTIRKNHFLMKAKAHREHRIALIIKMLQSDLLKHGDWSFFCNSNLYNPQHINYLGNKFKISNIDLEIIRQLYNNGPYNLQSEKGVQSDEINAWTDKTFTPYENAYFNICFETMYENEHKSLTEKVFKPIVNFQPFFFVAYPGALKLLRDLGFKTFHGFIDESYDDVENPADRMNLIHEEVKRLCSMSIEEIHKWYWEMEDILIHNHNTLINYNQKRNFGGELIEELSAFVNGRIV